MLAGVLVPPLEFWIWNYNLLENSFSKNLYHIETSQLPWIAFQFTG